MMWFTMWIIVLVQTTTSTSFRDDPIRYTCLNCLNVIINDFKTSHKSHVCIRDATIEWVYEMTTTLIILLSWNNIYYIMAIFPIFECVFRVIHCTVCVHILLERVIENRLLTESVLSWCKRVAHLWLREDSSLAAPSAAQHRNVFNDFVKVHFAGHKHARMHGYTLHTHTHVSSMHLLCATCETTGATTIPRHDKHICWWRYFASPPRTI